MWNVALQVCPSSRRRLFGEANPRAAAAAAWRFMLTHTRHSTNGVFIAALSCIPALNLRGRDSRARMSVPCQQPGFALSGFNRDSATIRFKHGPQFCYCLSVLATYARSKMASSQTAKPCCGTACVLGTFVSQELPTATGAPHHRQCTLRLW